MTTLAIEDYALIGEYETAALTSRLSPAENRQTG
jgi:hypothetical protein